MHVYSNTFFNYIEQGAIASARTFLPLIKNNIAFKTVADVGCGRGAWLTVFREYGATEIVGVDGSYVDKNNLLVDAHEFIEHDLSQPLVLSKKYDLAISLEVAEHIQASSADIFIDNLVGLSDVIVFSAAVQGQGGEYHVNEQPLRYWKEKFESRGYQCYDYIRRQVANNNDIRPWYKYNTLIYANAEDAERLSADVLKEKVTHVREPQEYADLGWKVRLAIVKNLPSSVVIAIAKMMSAYSNALGKA